MNLLRWINNFGRSTKTIVFDVGTFEPVEITVTPLGDNQFSALSWLGKDIILAPSWEAAVARLHEKVLQERVLVAG